MYDKLQNQYGEGYSASYAVERNRVLRNTYWLLALSMIPTVLGAWVGVSTGLLAAMGAGPSMILFFVGAFGLMFVVERTKNSSTGVYALLAFTFFMGLMLSQLLTSVLRFGNGAQLIMMAFGGTAAIFFAMASLATVIKRDLSGMGKFLFIGAVILMVASIASFFFQSSAMVLTILVMSMAIFSAFMLYDLKRIIDGGETNYISATLALYLDLYNVFQSLLSLLGIFGGDRR
ncbi:Bax inhibitor-1/YccA family protein [Paucibacter sp. R3-3]|uniref:Bax inhibitor-1/YccA family protein n=1 Tax=Roseateles agri TaxID=3098619 RepID=A0ABU5DKH4_9BURK|nr:Bax inhibitor-1/YccA family protein [Paucibacter sp. R3-3]MDY0746634.1 Bax inhibitor-1/YccA family protein [Paucibacter sp. R3-3]